VEAAKNLAGATSTSRRARVVAALIIVGRDAWSTCARRLTGMEAFSSEVVPPLGGT
jgi:hypothetical protein